MGEFETDRKDIAALHSLMREMYHIITLNGEINGFVVTAHNGEYAAPILRNMIARLGLELEAENVDAGKLCSEMKRQYSSMFPPKSGLSEFYIWSDDYDTRKKINDEFDRIHKEIENRLTAERGSAGEVL